MNTDPLSLKIVITLTPSDHQKLLASGQTIPDFWSGHSIPPAAGDVLRFGQWQCAVIGRSWEFEDQQQRTLRLYMTDLEPRRDEALH